MNLDFRGRRTAILAFIVIGVVTATATAQTGAAPTNESAPDAAALQRKVEALEKQVEALQKQVAEMKRRQQTFRLIPPGQPRVTVPPSLSLPGQNEPPLGTPFEFNGRTYYRMLLQEGASPKPAAK